MSNVKLLWLPSAVFDRIAHPEEIDRRFTLYEEVIGLAGNTREIVLHQDRDVLWLLRSLDEYKTNLP